MFIVIKIFAVHRMKGAKGMKYGFVMKEDKIVAAFQGEGQKFDMAAHAFMMSGYGVKRVSKEEYQMEKRKS